MMNYDVVFLPFPDDVYGCIHLRKDGSYLIGINAALPDDVKARAIEHELEHIKRGHFDDPRPVMELEDEAGEVMA